MHAAYCVGNLLTRPLVGEAYASIPSKFQCTLAEGNAEIVGAWLARALLAVRPPCGAKLGHQHAWRPNGCPTLCNRAAKSKTAVLPLSSYSRSLLRLNLSNCSLGEDGSAYICDVLKENAVLQEVQLASNNLGAEACQVLAAGMQANQSLQRAVLDNNPIGVEGVAKLVECLLQAHVSEVSLWNCHLGEFRRPVSDTTFDISRPNRRLVLLQGQWAFGRFKSRLPCCLQAAVHVLCLTSAPWARQSDWPGLYCWCVSKAKAVSAVPRARRSEE